ncbi:outer membrane beta-barrel protein [Jiulongibacter sp. NS-SX5]|uniref:outer membrane beta-barrel protein n=1 Tax=Jiulongibacter sp. NS-SX5 TaxID=3463854 RepID=UPI004059E56E
MKRFLVLSFLFISTLGFAQMEQSTFVFGPKIGLQANTVRIVDNPSPTSSKLNMQYHAGVFTRLNFGEKLSLQPEAVFQVKGGNLADPAQKLTYRYLSTPILLGVSPLDGLFIEAGPEFNWALNAGWQKNGVEQYGPDAARDNAFIVGARIDLLDMFSMFSINLRYIHGLNNINTRVEHNNSPLDFRNRTFQISATYNFSEYYKWWKKYGLKKSKK